MLGFFSVLRPNRDPPLPQPQASVAPFLLRGVTHSLGGEGVGGPNSDEGDRHCGTLGKYVLYGAYRHLLNQNILYNAIVSRYSPTLL